MQTDKAKAKKQRRKPAIAEVQEEEAVGISHEAPPDLPPTEPQPEPQSEPHPEPPDIKPDAEVEDEPLSESDSDAEAALEADTEQPKAGRKKKQPSVGDEKASRPPARSAFAPSALTCSCAAVVSLISVCACVIV